jgi:hypothetical protein
MTQDSLADAVDVAASERTGFSFRSELLLWDMQLVTVVASVQATAREISRDDGKRQGWRLGRAVSVDFHHSNLTYV